MIQAVPEKVSAKIDVLTAKSKHRALGNIQSCAISSLVEENSRSKPIIVEKMKETSITDKSDHIPPAKSQLILEIRSQHRDHDRQLDEVGTMHKVEIGHDLETSSQLCVLGCQLDHCHKFFTHEIVPNDMIKCKNLFENVIEKFENLSQVDKQSQKETLTDINNCRSHKESGELLTHPVNVN